MVRKLVHTKKRIGPSERIRWIKVDYKLIGLRRLPLIHARSQKKRILG